MKVHHQIFTFFFTLRIDGLLHCTDCICTENFRIVLPKNILNCKFSRQRYIKYDLVNTLDLILTPYFLVSFQFNFVCSYNVSNTYERDKVVKENIKANCEIAWPF